VEWGQVNAKSGFIRSVRFRYYVSLGEGVLLGDRASIYNANGYKNYLADRNKPYVAQSRTNPYAGTYFLPVQRWWFGGSTTGKLLVNIDKHAQKGAFELGDDCHGIFTVVYGVQ
jgi:hypothetical protein